MTGEYSWMNADGPDDWTVADESDHDEPTEYEIVRMRVEPVQRRWFGSIFCPACDGTGGDADSCGRCRGEGSIDPNDLHEREDQEPPTRCTCDPGEDFCRGEDPDHPDYCQHCGSLDGERPCPAEEPDLDPPCPIGCGHVHYGRCLLWRCHCPGVSS